MQYILVLAPQIELMPKKLNGTEITIPLIIDTLYYLLVEHIKH
jgi:hypothetical protein